MTEVHPNSDYETLANRNFWLRMIWISVAWIVVPLILSVVGTVFGMFRAFGTLAENNEADPSVLADDISVSLSLTMGSMVVSFLAFIFFIVALVRFLKLPPPSRLNLSQTL